MLHKDEQSNERTGLMTAVTSSSSEIGQSVAPSSLRKIGLFAEKYQYDNVENCIRYSLPKLGCLTDDLKEAVAEDRYIIQDPLLGFRADSRKPEEIFMSGFSAYAFQRMDMFPSCNSLDCNWYNLFWWTFAPIFTCAPCRFPLDLVTCLVCGDKTYAYPFDSRWPALALTTTFSSAQQGFGTHGDFNYQYLVYMDGAIDFCKFSNEYVKKFPDKDMRRHPKKSYIRDENEIFPRDLNNQVVDGTQVIASTIPDENNDDEHYTAFVFNPRFCFFEQVKSFCKDENILQCRVETSKIGIFFQELSDELNIQYRPSHSANKCELPSSYRSPTMRGK